MIRRNIHLAYSLTLTGGRNYHARAYMTENGNPGLPEDHTFKTGAGVGNSADSAQAACKEALAELLKSYPESKGVHIFFYGRQSDAIVSAAPVVSYWGKNYFCGIMGA